MPPEGTPAALTGAFESVRKGTTKLHEGLTGTGTYLLHDAIHASVGCIIRWPGSESTPTEASLWALSGHHPQRQTFIKTLQQRQAARKAAKVSSQPAQQPSLQSFLPGNPMASGKDMSAASTAGAQLDSSMAGQSEPTEPDQDLQLVSSDAPAPAKERPAIKGLGAIHAAANGARRTGDIADAPEHASKVARDPNSQAALRVQSLRQELAAAELVVSELKAWLAEAEAEIEAEGTCRT